MTDKSPTVPVSNEIMNLSKVAQQELGGDSLNFVIVVYNDTSVKLFKPSPPPQQRMLMDTEILPNAMVEKLGRGNCHIVNGQLQCS